MGGGRAVWQGVGSGSKAQLSSKVHWATFCGGWPRGPGGGHVLALNFAGEPTFYV